LVKDNKSLVILQLQVVSSKNLANIQAKAANTQAMEIDIKQWDLLFIPIHYNHVLGRETSIKNIIKRI